MLAVQTCAVLALALSAALAQPGITKGSGPTGVQIAAVVPTSAGEIGINPVDIPPVTT